MIHGSLSSSMTGIYKYLFLPLWSGIFGWVTLQLFAHPESVVFNGVRGGAPPGIEWLFLGIWIPITTFLALLAVRLHWVRAYGSGLYATAVGREVMIPASRIQKIDPIPWLRPTIVRVRFYSEEGVLRTIWFMPEVTWLRGTIDTKLLEDLKSFPSGAQKPAA